MEGVFAEPPESTLAYFCNIRNKAKLAKANTLLEMASILAMASNLLAMTSQSWIIGFLKPELFHRQISTTFSDDSTLSHSLGKRDGFLDILGRCCVLGNVKCCTFGIFVFMSSQMSVAQLSSVCFHFPLIRCASA